MQTYLLTWNPKRWPWDDLEEHLADFRAKRKWKTSWSTGNTRRIQPGDRLFLIRLGKEPKGIIGSGRAASTVYSDDHWDDDRQERGDQANYVDIEFDMLLSVEQLMPIPSLRKGPWKQVHWSPQASGVKVDPRAAQWLECRWAEHLGRQRPVPFYVGQEYTRNDIYDILDVPHNARVVNRNLGYEQHGDDWLILATASAPLQGRQRDHTRWIGDELSWSAGTGVRQDHPDIQAMLAPDARVLIFTRRTERAPFVYRGTAAAGRVKGSDPVTILWRFGRLGDGRTAQSSDEGVAPALYTEGATRFIHGEIHERSPAAREACIRKHGCKCIVCGFKFDRVYGALGEGFIHVHHIEPLSQKTAEYVVDPIEDLKPVCPNCHAMLHRNDRVLSIDELKEIVEHQRELGDNE